MGRLIGKGAGEYGHVGVLLAHSEVVHRRLLDVSFGWRSSSDWRAEAGERAEHCGRGGPGLGGRRRGLSQKDAAALAVWLPSRLRRRRLGHVEGCSTERSIHFRIGGYENEGEGDVARPGPAGARLPRAGVHPSRRAATWAAVAIAASSPNRAAATRSNIRVKPCRAISLRRAQRREATTRST